MISSSRDSTELAIERHFAPHAFMGFGSRVDDMSRDGAGLSDKQKLRTHVDFRYIGSQEFGTVIEDIYDLNVDSEKELSLEQKLNLAKTKRSSTNQNTIQKSAISKTIRREIDLIEDETFRGKYLERNIAYC
ncbi:hypothetical protein TNCV_4469111 [Trichonephila clavipes]|nr:hypothetical protein TNCV_4469111 [Trichonephila clavipes]